MITWKSKNLFIGSVFLTLFRIKKYVCTKHYLMHNQFYGVIGGKYVVRCAIWYHLYNLKNVKTTHGEVLILVKLQA